ASPPQSPYPASSSRAGAGWSCTRAGLLCSAAVACASPPSRMDGSCATIRPSVRRNLNTRYRDAVFPAAVPLSGQLLPRGGGLELHGGGAFLRRGGGLRGLRRVIAFEDGLQLRHH